MSESINREWVVVNNKCMQVDIDKPIPGMTPYEDRQFRRGIKLYRDMEKNPKKYLDAFFEVLLEEENNSEYNRGFADGYKKCLNDTRRN